MQTMLVLALKIRVERRSVPKIAGHSCSSERMKLREVQGFRYATGWILAIGPWQNSRNRGKLDDVAGGIRAECVKIITEMLLSFSCAFTGKARN